ncbi:MAG: hypothetical protein HOD92_18735 [Deltaproteobacteria bacterium]|jgi:hypothetical protein|nr:hypothetical protein [Deltaproteobacteria bacterium]MBT4526445.1 hypothetical protein [Deltaproteobacteria bacterium]
MKLKLRTCVSPKGCFVYGIHKPAYAVENLRGNSYLETLGKFPDGSKHTNLLNFPESNIEVEKADVIYEIPNPFPFRGATYINSHWANRNVNNINDICLPRIESTSFSQLLKKVLEKQKLELTEETLRAAFQTLDQPLLITLASRSTDQEDLSILAKLSCDFIWDEADPDKPIGLKYQNTNHKIPKAVIHNHPVFETVVNNPALPEIYKKLMVLKPGAQGGSEIVGEIGKKNEKSHVYEYLRRNSYIAWGHYAANMADDSVRYQIDDLTLDDIQNMRFLYYQRTYVRLASELGLALPVNQKTLSIEALESLRLEILDAINNDCHLNFDGTIWGWNFGFDFAPSLYRLHASHQQIHQQYAMVPNQLESICSTGEPFTEGIPVYSCGDLVTEFAETYYDHHQQHFFDDYLQAIYSNKRMDNGSGDSSLVIFEDENVILFVPKAQVSQWEIQLMTKKPEGNILEASQQTRSALDQGLLLAQKILAGLGARMVTSIEYAKRINVNHVRQHLIYALLPKLPESPGAFSEAQLRWINGHYPEDFAAACRAKLKKINI